MLYDAHDADIVVWARSRSILAKNKKRGGVAGGGGCVCLMWRGMGVAVEEGGGFCQSVSQ